MNTYHYYRYVCAAWVLVQIYIWPADGSRDPNVDSEALGQLIFGPCEQYRRWPEEGAAADISFNSLKFRDGQVFREKLLNPWPQNTLAKPTSGLLWKDLWPFSVRLFSTQYSWHKIGKGKLIWSLFIPLFGLQLSDYKINSSVILIWIFMTAS